MQYFDRSELFHFLQGDAIVKPAQCSFQWDSALKVTLYFPNSRERESKKKIGPMCSRVWRPPRARYMNHWLCSTFIQQAFLLFLRSAVCHGGHIVFLEQTTLLADIFLLWCGSNNGKHSEHSTTGIPVPGQLRTAEENGIFR